MDTQELKRQLFHACAGVFIVALFYYSLLPLWIFFTVVITGIVIYIAWKKSANPVFEWFFTNFERKNEPPGWGALWYCVGCFLTFVIFPQNIAFASILILALGDSISTFVGKGYGRIKHPFNKKKKIEGTLAGIILATLGAWIFVPFIPAVIASFVAMNLEAVHWRKYQLNDNLLLPLIAGLILSLFI
jgi:dolichol kinase